MNEHPIEHKILMVDDERNVLESFGRQLKCRYDFDTALSASSALEKMKSIPYSVIIADMQMPYMDGAQFLREVRRLYPDTSRIMLTGNPDQKTAAKAVNESGILKFLNKPCSVEELTAAIDSGIAHHESVLREHDLLRKTLSGSVKILTDLLGAIEPESFCQRLNARPILKRLLFELKLPNAWEIELAAMLTDIGYLLLPPALTVRLRAGLHLTPKEMCTANQMYKKMREILSNVPRLEGVANIVYFARKNYDGTGLPRGTEAGQSLPVGARIIKIFLDYAQLEQEYDCELSREKKLHILRQRLGQYDLAIFEDFERIVFSMPCFNDNPGDFEALVPEELKVGDVVASDIETADGVVLVTKDAPLTELLLTRVANYAKLIGLRDRVKIYRRSAVADTSVEHSRLAH